MKPLAILVALLTMLGIGLGLGPEGQAAGPLAPKSLPTEQENAAEKFFSALETSLSQNFFDIRHRPVIRVAVFDFTDEKGNVVKAGKDLAEKINRRLYRQSQFEVLDQEKLQRYLAFYGQNTLGKLDAAGLDRFQRRLNTLEPDHGIHALVVGEIQKGVSRNLRITASIVNFQYSIDAFAYENNLLDAQQIIAEIPYPTEQALAEAAEVVMPAVSRPFEEGRLIILANTRGNNLFATTYAQSLSAEKPFLWEKIPYVMILGKEEVNIPGQIRIGIENLVLSPLERRKDSAERLEFSFLHGKFSTNEVFFDDRVPAETYSLLTSFVDLKTNETYSDMASIGVHPGVTTVVVLSYYVPSEKERIRNKQVPGIQIYQLFGKGMEFLPKR